VQAEPDLAHAATATARLNELEHRAGTDRASQRLRSVASSARSRAAPPSNIAGNVGDGLLRSIRGDGGHRRERSPPRD
jgi:hypothetical protein